MLVLLAGSAVFRDLYSHVWKLEMRSQHSLVDMTMVLEKVLQITQMSVCRVRQNEL